MVNPSNTFFSNKIRTLIFQKKVLIIHTFLVAVIDSVIPVVQISLLGYLVMQMLSGTDAEMMFALILYLLTFFAQHIAAYCKNRAQLKLKLDFAQIIEEDVIKKVNETSLANRLEPKFHDRFAAVQNALSPGQISNMIVLMIESLIVFLTVTFIMVNLITVTFIAALIILMLMVIIFPLQIKANNNYRDRVLFGYAREQNTINTLENDIFSRQGFIEMSIMGYHKWVKNIWLHKFRSLRRVRLRESMKLETLNHLLSTTWHLSPPLVAIIVIMNDQISISQFVILFGSMYYLIPRVFSAAELFTRLQESLGLFRKVTIFMEEDSPRAKHVVYPATEPRYVQCNDVSFAYPNQTNTLSNVNLKFCKGDVICIVGENGSGKSTLVKLILALLDPSEGDIKFDEQCKVPKGSAFFQNFIKLNETIRDNVAIGKDGTSTDEQISRALKDAQGEFALKLGIDTSLDIELDGINISGGQWQRLGLARTFLKEDGIIILDEPAASLDPFAEIELYTRVIEKYKGRTIILVSHRLTATILADQILVVSEGGISEAGTHQQLMKHDGLYQRFFNLQALPYLDYYKKKKTQEVN